MEIAIIIPGELPVPPVKGGAIENLVYTLIKENEDSLNPINIDLYGIDHKFNEIYNTNQKYTKYILGNKTPAILEKGFISKLCYKVNYSYFLNQTINNMRKKEYDYIIIQNRPSYVKKVNLNNKSKIILHMHNEHLTKDINYQDEINICDKIFVVSQYIKDTILKKYRVDKEKVKVVHNGIDSNKFKAISKLEKSNLRKKYKIKEDDFVILFTGRMIKEKGILELINSVLNIKNKEDIKLLVIGAKNFANIATDDFTNLLFEKCKSKSNKIIFTGYIDYNEVPKAYAIADIAVLPSIFDDPFPLAILECMSIGLPIISTYAGGIPEMVTEKCGELVFRDDSIEENLKNAIIKYYNKRNDLEYISNNCRNRVEEVFNNKVFYKTFIKFLQ